MQAISDIVQLNLNFTYTRVCLACLMHAKLQKLVCACTVECNFGMCMWASEYMQYMRDVCHKLSLGLPHYMYHEPQ